MEVDQPDRENTAGMLQKKEVYESRASDEKEVPLVVTTIDYSTLKENEIMSIYKSLSLERSSLVIQFQDYARKYVELNVEEVKKYANDQVKIQSLILDYYKDFNILWLNNMEELKKIDVYSNVEQPASSRKRTPKRIRPSRKKESSEDEDNALSTSEESEGSDLGDVVLPEDDDEDIDITKKYSKIKKNKEVIIIEKGTKSRPTKVSKNSRLKAAAMIVDQLDDHLGSDSEENERQERRLISKKKKIANSNNKIDASNLWSNEELQIPDQQPKEKIVDKILHWRQIATEREYFHFSYHHATWVSQSFIETLGDHAKGRLTRFIKVAHEPFDSTGDAETFDPSFLEVDRILAARSEEIHMDTDTKVNESNKENIYYLVKWNRLSYAESTWELASNLKDDDKIDAFSDINAIPEDAFSKKVRPAASSFKSFTESPDYPGNHILRPWQIDGVNWLLYSWYHKRGVILADEMGLGKTVQTVATLQHIREVYSRGPFLVIVPLSTIPHWKREFEGWTEMNTIVYQGTAADRNIIRYYEFKFWDAKGKEVNGIYKFEVLLTTYEALMSDFGVLSQIPFKCIIVDEAHRMKNQDSKLFRALLSFPTEWRMILTGTPIQNNVEELWTLLHYIDADSFKNLRDFLSEFGNMQNDSQVVKLQTILRPYLLRRVKEDVAKHIPPKEETIIEVELTSIQKQYYRAVLERNQEFLNKGLKNSAQPKLLNIVMQLRKVCNHPYLIKGAYEKLVSGLDSKDDHLKRLVESSGKLVLVDKLLPKLKKDGHKVLIFSQMKAVLDLLGDYCQLQGYQFERIDGDVRGNERQSAIDRFCKPDSEKFVFLLCTRAGGVGINLTAADTVLIYDSDWNPQNDIQAQARCHRIGQTKDVKVYRLITANTYEKKMFMRASMKLGLDQAILSNMRTGTNKGEGENAEGIDPKKMTKKEIDDLLKYGAYDVFKDEDDTAANAFCQQDIEDILLKRSTLWSTGGNVNQEKHVASSFSKATFLADEASAKIDLDDPNFWQNILPKDAKSAKNLLSRVETPTRLFSDDDDRAAFMRDIEKYVDEVVTSKVLGQVYTDLEYVVAILNNLVIRDDISAKDKDQVRDWLESIENPRRARRNLEDKINKVININTDIAVVKTKHEKPSYSLYSGKKYNNMFENGYNPFTSTNSTEEASPLFRIEKCNGLGGIYFSKTERDRLEDSIFRYIGGYKQLAHKNAEIWILIRKDAGCEYRSLVEIMAFVFSFLDLCDYLIQSDIFGKNARKVEIGEAELVIFKEFRELLTALVPSPMPESYYSSTFKKYRRSAFMTMAKRERSLNNKDNDLNDPMDDDENEIKKDTPLSDEEEDDEENDYDVDEDNEDPDAKKSKKDFEADQVVQFDGSYDVTLFENFDIDPSRAKNPIDCEPADINVFMESSFQKRIRGNVKRLSRLFSIFKSLVNEIDQIGDPSEIPTKLYQEFSSFPKCEFAGWWNRQCDIDFLIGNYRYGLGEYEQIKNDPTLIFKSMFENVPTLNKRPEKIGERTLTADGQYKVTSYQVRNNKLLKAKYDVELKILNEKRIAVANEIVKLVEYKNQVLDYYKNSMNDESKASLARAESEVASRNSVLDNINAEIAHFNANISKLPDIESLEKTYRAEMTKLKTSRFGSAPNCSCNTNDNSEQRIIGCNHCQVQYHQKCIFEGKTRPPMNWLCPRCDIKWPWGRTLEARLRVLYDFIDKKRKVKVAPSPSTVTVPQSHRFSRMGHAPTTLSVSSFEYYAKTKRFKAKDIPIGVVFRKSERIDYIKFLTIHGRPKNYFLAQCSAGLGNKTIEQLDLYFQKLYDQCAWIRKENNRNSNIPIIYDPRQQRRLKLIEWNNRKLALIADRKLNAWNHERPHHSWLATARMSGRLCFCQRICGGRFMSCCTKCSHWVHGECTGATDGTFQKFYTVEKNEDKKTRRRLYVCPDCISEKPFKSETKLPLKFKPSGKRKSVKNPMKNQLGVKLIELIKEMYKQNEAAATSFNEPVDPVALGIPDYWELITFPMDLGTVIFNINNKAYSSLWQAFEDVRLVWLNCLSYNSAASEIGETVSDLQLLFESLVMKSFEEADRTFGKDDLMLEAGLFENVYMPPPPPEIATWIDNNLDKLIKISSDPAAPPMYDLPVEPTESALNNPPSDLDNKSDDSNLVFPNTKYLIESAKQRMPYGLAKNITPAIARELSIIMQDKVVPELSVDDTYSALVTELDAKIAICDQVISTLESDDITDVNALLQIKINETVPERNGKGVLAINAHLTSVAGIQVTEDTPEIVDDAVGLSAALRLVERVELLYNLSDAMKQDDIEIIKGIRMIKMRGLHKLPFFKCPNWWKSTLHDQALLKGLCAYGFGFIELMRFDPVLRKILLTNGDASEAERDSFLIEYLTDKIIVARRVESLVNSIDEICHPERYHDGEPEVENAERIRKPRGPNKAKLPSLLDPDVDVEIPEDTASIVVRVSRKRLHDIDDEPAISVKLMTQLSVKKQKIIKSASKLSAAKLKSGFNPDMKKTIRLPMRTKNAGCITSIGDAHGNHPIGFEATRLYYSPYINPDSLIAYQCKIIEHEGSKLYSLKSHDMEYPVRGPTPAFCWNEINKIIGHEPFDLIKGEEMFCLSEPSLIHYLEWKCIHDEHKIKNESLDYDNDENNNNESDVKLGDNDMVL